MILCPSRAMFVIVCDGSRRAIQRHGGPHGCNEDGDG